MSVIADLIRAGVDPDLIERVHQEIVEAARVAPAPQSLRQARNARYYQSRKSRDASEFVLIETNKTDQDDSVLPPKEKSPTPPKEITPIPSSSLRSDEPRTRGTQKIRETLEAVLSPEVAAGVIEHRQKLKKPLTQMGAAGLARQFAATGQPDDAARMMIEQAWQGFRADWFARGSQPRAGPRETAGDVMMGILQQASEGRQGGFFDDTAGDSAPDGLVARLCR